MAFGLAFANVGPFARADQAVRLARAAEAAGFESVWTVDHVVVPAGYRSRYPYDPSGKLPSGDATVFPDPLVWLAYVAATTATIRLGTGVLVVPQRQPLLLAKQLATLDDLSGGRMLLGAGIGWLEEEFAALGVPFADRGLRTEEAIEAMRALWSEDRATFEGTTVAFRDCVLRPQPRQGAIPVHVGGHSRAAAERAGRVGDGFFPFGVGDDELPALVDAARTSAAAAGADPGSFEVTVSSALVSGHEARSQAKSLTDLGVNRIVVPAALFREDPEGSLARYRDDVMEHVR